MIIDHHVIHVHKHTFSLNIEFDTAKKKKIITENNNNNHMQLLTFFIIDAFAELIEAFGIDHRANAANK